MSIEIYISDICGLCYGASNAISHARNSLKEKSNVVLYKEILHNQNVINELKTNGATIKNALSEISPSDYVIVRAHGEPHSTFKYFEENKISYLDCTCPNVKAINFLVKDKDSLGYKIIIIGKHGFDGKPMHPEVLATSGWCSNPILIEDESEIQNINLTHDKYYLVIQTTFSKDKAISFVDKIKNIMKLNNKVFEYRNTICNAQKNINKAAEELANNVDAMIVIGGKNSSNSKELFNNVSSIKKSYFIENPSNVFELVNEFRKNNFKKIGITAGASTMKEDILEVKRILESKLK
jgi:4-hydroxy-3-methylbut-2-enyl diphosphate reductase